MKFSLALERGSSPRSSLVLSRERSPIIPLTPATRSVLPDSVLFLQSLISSGSYETRINKFLSTSSDEYDSKEPAVLNETFRTDPDNLVSSPTENGDKTPLFGEFEKLIATIEESDSNSKEKIEELRSMVLKYGLPSIGFESLSNLRSKIWKLVLGVPSNAIDSDNYHEKLKVLTLRIFII